jgi:O-Antigen ligase
MPPTEIRGAQGVVEPKSWPLKTSVLLLVLGTVHYVAKDDLHVDGSGPQALIEITATALAACIAIGAAFFYGAKPRVRAPYVFLIGTLLLAVAFASRSWDPAMSLVRGVLLVLVSTSTVALLGTYGLRPLIRNLLYGYVILVLFGLIASILAPDDYPLMLHDPGQETLRARLHIFKIHPIALADDCVICLITSVVLTGSWVRVCRAVLLACLLLTVARAPMILGLVLYALAQAFTAGTFARGMKRVGVVAIVVLASGAIIAATAMAAGWTDSEELTGMAVRLVDATRDDQTLTGRIPLWATFVSDLSFENFYGYGIAGARYYLRTLNTWASHSHNSLLESVYVSGYLGLLAMLVAVCGAFMSAFLCWRNHTARVVALAGLYVVSAGMMEPSWYDASSIILLTILCSCPWNAPERPHRSSVSPVTFASRIPPTRLQSAN